MLKNILKINGVSELNKKAQQNVVGGFGDPKVYDPELCASCGGTSLPNGFCLIAAANEFCLEEGS